MKSLFAVVLLFAVAKAGIMDYSHADYIPIIEGEVVVWDTFRYLTHTIKITKYYDIIEETNKLANRFQLEHMRALLQSDCDHLETLLSILNGHHRTARSLNFLGSFLKVITGTPDYYDMEQSRIIEAQLIHANNQQRGINYQTSMQINELTDQVNRIIQNLKEVTMDPAHLYETLLARNRIVGLEIQNVILSITLARVNLINPVILDSIDVDEILKSRATNITVREILEVGSITVALNSSTIHFVVAYPEAKNKCKKITVVPVEHRGLVLDLEEGNIIADCDGHIISMSSCKATTSFTFCKESSKNTCARQLHTGGIAHCKTRPSHLLPMDQVEEGFLIINDRMARVTVDGAATQKINGTFLITFEREAKVNETVFVNRNGIPKRTPGAATVSQVNITGYNEVLSLTFLRRLNDDNIDHIKEITVTINKRPLAFLSVGFVFFMIATALNCWWCRRRCSSAEPSPPKIRSLRKTDDSSEFERQQLSGREVTAKSKNYD